MPELRICAAAAQTDVGTGGIGCSHHVDEPVFAFGKRLSRHPVVVVEGELPVLSWEIIDCKRICTIVGSTVHIIVGGGKDGTGAHKNRKHLERGFHDGFRTAGIAQLRVVEINPLATRREHHTALHGAFLDHGCDKQIIAP